jgi:hypothetical protein
LRYYELFDYVHTRSPYVGTDRWFNPSVFSGLGITPFPYRPPYNRLSRFRDPGRVNINTIPYFWDRGADNVWGSIGDDNGDGVAEDVYEAGWPGSDDTIQSRVWEGIAKNFPVQDPSDPLGGALGSDMLRRLLFSRRGVPSDVGITDPANPLFNPRGKPAALHPLAAEDEDPLAFNLDVPTRFGNPFRTAASSDLMPRVTDPAVNAADYLPKDGVEATLLRPDPTTASFPLFGFASTNALNHTDRTPHFRYQGLSRLANLLTTHSNVFAVWITVGYFEVEPNPGGADAAHPDGFRLGREVGSMTGETKRHRGFYIIDRSIPVGFAPGENHNVERAILLRRVIE